jgi:hypothetical protein
MLIALRLRMFRVGGSQLVGAVAALTTAIAHVSNHGALCRA